MALWRQCHRSRCNIACGSVCVCSTQVTNDALEFLVGKTPSPFAQCPDANVSICAATEAVPFVVVAYNQLAQQVTCSIPCTTCWCPVHIRRQRSWLTL